MNKPIKRDTNRALWAEPPHHRPDKYLYMPDPSIPLHEQTLLGVTIPPQTEDEQNDKDWQLNEASVRQQIGDRLLQSEITPEADLAYDEHKARINAATAKNAATVRQLEQDSWDRYHEEYGYPVEPEGSQSLSRVRQIVGARTRTK